MAGMREAGPGKFEYQVQAAIEQIYLKNGAMSWSYPSIVASGPNATTLHYEASLRKMEAGDLLLVDAAADYQGMSGDITRTYPVSGTFTDAQKDIYRIVQAAQDAGIKAATVGHRTRDIEVAVEDVVRAGLVKLGLVTDATGDQFRIWYPHGICHWIGLDVHDVGDYSRPLEAGMAFTIEPGIYIRDGALDRLPDTPENKAFQEKVRPVVKKYLNIGVRLEDSFLLTETGPENLSAHAPHTIEEIEAFLQDEARREPVSSRAERIRHVVLLKFAGSPAGDVQIAIVERKVDVRDEWRHSFERLQQRAADDSAIGRLGWDLDYLPHLEFTVTVLIVPIPEPNRRREILQRSHDAHKSVLLRRIVRRAQLEHHLLLGPEIEHLHDGGGSASPTRATGGRICLPSSISGLAPFSNMAGVPHSLVIIVS